MIKRFLNTPFAAKVIIVSWGSAIIIGVVFMVVETWVSIGG